MPGAPYIGLIDVWVPLLHVHGVRTQASVNRGCGQNFYLDVGSFGSYTARAGDRIVFQQRSILARGGLAIQFSNGNTIAWDVPDQVGNPINYDAPDGNWHTRVVALPQSVSGTSVQAITVTTEHQTGVGTYDTWIGDVAIVSSDGAVTPVYRGQPVGSTTWGVCDDNTSVATEQTPVDGFTGTTYSAGDQVGTIQMEFAVDAWPIQRSEFAPFGQELSSQDFTRNRFKFTGKERDAESGLDYFGARYYNSAFGRWMSPDSSNWGVDFHYPQTWNHYAYVSGNPLTNTDSNGLWLTPTHNRIINNSFPGLSREQRQILQASSKEVDTHQGQEDQFMHGMDSIHNNVSEGLSNPEIGPAEFIQQNEQNAKTLQAAWIASGHNGISPAALAAFGNALHTITDEYSPSHVGFQQVHWYSYPLHWREGLAMVGFYTNSIKAAEASARSAFYDVFGSISGDQATREKVTVRLIYDQTEKASCPAMIEAHERSRMITRNRSVEIVFASAVGSFIACGSMIPIFLGEGRDFPRYAAIPLNVLGSLGMPGIYLSLVLSGSTHDPKLLLATVLNAAMYSMIVAWIARTQRGKSL